MTTPFIFSWPLTIPVLPAPGAIPSTSFLAPGAGVAGCNPAYFTEAQLLAILDRILPEWYLAPLIDPGPGYELFQAYAKTLERASLAIGHFECANYVISSHGGVRALASVEFYRATSSAGPFIVKQGTICRTSKTNRSYRLIEDVAFPPDIHATATFTTGGPLVIEAITGGPVGNGIIVNLVAGGFGVPTSLDESNPQNITITFNYLGGDGQPDATWAIIEALINTSTIIQVQSNAAAGALVLGDAASKILAGGAYSLFVAAQVEAVAPGFEYNVPGPFSTADGTVLPGEIDTIPIPILDPLFAEPTIQVRQIADAAGGQPAVLDQLGLDRRLPRLPDEVDEIYKGRIRALPDTVSLAAIRRQLDAIFLVLGLSYDLIETWENRYQSCWDAPLGDITHPTMGLLWEGTFAFDDPRTDPFFGRWMDERDCPAGLVLVVPNLTSWEMRGFAYDDDGAGASAPGSFTTTLGRRATSAYDAPDADTPVLFVPFYDGDDRLKALFYIRLWDLLRQIKGAGVHVAIELKGQ
jgi:hypothetical protein